MASPADPQQQRLLEELQRAGDHPLAFSALRAAGISFPAAVIAEIALGGHLVNGFKDDRLIGVRLVNPERIDGPSSRSRRRSWRWTQLPGA